MRQGFFIVLFITGMSLSPESSSGASTGPDSAASTTTSSSLSPIIPAQSSISPVFFDIRVATQPETAAVFLDDSGRGISPCSISGVSAGNHQLTLRKKGCYLKKAEITVDAASPKEFSFVLLQPALLVITTTPSGAAVSIDDKREGFTTFSNDKMKPGIHIVKLLRVGFAPVDSAITLESGGRDTLRVTFERSAAYKDSLAAEQRVAEKKNKEKNTLAIFSAIFVILATALIVLEAGKD